MTWQQNRAASGFHAVDSREHRTDPPPPLHSLQASTPPPSPILSPVPSCKERYERKVWLLFSDYLGFTLNQRYWAGGGGGEGEKIGLWVWILGLRERREREREENICRPDLSNNTKTRERERGEKNIVYIHEGLFFHLSCSKTSFSYASGIIVKSCEHMRNQNE